MKKWLAYITLKMLGYNPESGANYTSRCLGCGYFEGEADAGKDHYGYSCGSTEVAWWEPIKIKINEAWARKRRRHGSAAKKR